MGPHQGQSKWVPLAITGWLALALLLGASGALQGLRPPIPQIILLALTALLLAAGVWLPSFRHWTATIDLRIVVAFHLTRFVGVYFLILYQQGELPYAFAVPGGWGDIIVASLALILLLVVQPNTTRGRRLYLGWNVLGLIDILAVVATAAVQAMARPESMQALLRLPLSLLPTFLVPLIIASHVLIFIRLSYSLGQVQTAKD